MTVDDLLAALTGAFPAFNAKAMESWAPVFRVRLAKHEGPVLQQAYLDTLAAFTVAKSKALFPVAADFEANLPSNHPKIAGDGGPSIRQAVKEQNERKTRNFNEWHRGQGAKIKANRPAAVYNACVLLAAQMAKLDGRLPLTAEQIKSCEDRALSQGRAAMFGPLPKDNDVWLNQIEQVKAAWVNPQMAAA